MNFSDTGGSDTSVYWKTNFSGGWVHLLPPLAGKRLLCLSPHDAAVWMLSGSCERVTRIEDSPLPTPTLSASFVCDRVDLDAAASQAAATDRWHGLIVHDPQGLWLTKATLPRFARLLANLSNLLTEDAFVYVATANRWSPFRLSNAEPGTGERRAVASAPLKSIRGILKQAGWPWLRRFPLLMYGSTIAQVIADQGYQSSKNSERLREKAKQILLGRRGSAHWAPAYAYLGLRPTSERSVLDLVVERTGRLLSSGTRAAPVLKEYLVLSGNKSIVTCGLPGDDHADVVTVLAADSLSIERRIRSERS